jgi:hypothetical protein
VKRSNGSQPGASSPPTHELQRVIQSALSRSHGETFAKSFMEDHALAVALAVARCLIVSAFEEDPTAVVRCLGRHYRANGRGIWRGN